MSCLLSWHSNGFSAHFRKMKMYLRTCVRCHKKEEASITASLFSYLQKITKRSRSCITALLVINKKLAAKVCNFCHLTKFPRIFCRFILIFPDYCVPLQCKCCVCACFRHHTAVLEWTRLIRCYALC